MAIKPYGVAPITITLRADDLITRSEGKDQPIEITQIDAPTLCAVGYMAQWMTADERALTCALLAGIIEQLRSVR